MEGFHCRGGVELEAFVPSSNFAVASPLPGDLAMAVTLGML